MLRLASGGKIVAPGRQSNAKRISIVASITLRYSLILIQAPGLRPYGCRASQAAAISRLLAPSGCEAASLINQGTLL